MGWLIEKRVGMALRGLAYFYTVDTDRLFRGDNNCIFATEIILQKRKRECTS